MTDVSPVASSTNTVQVEGGQVYYNGEPTTIMQAVMLIQIGFAQESQGIAADRAQDAQDRLDEIKEVRSMISTMQTEKQYAADEKGDWAGYVNATDAKNYLEANGLEFSGYESGSGWASEDQMEVNIQTLQSHLDDLTSQNDLEMVKLKNTLNQQNEALTAANKFASDAYNLAMGIINKS